MNCAAVVIGVDRTGGLTPLKAAARGAREVATWLRQDSYDVTLLTDQPDPATNAAGVVTRKAILDAVTAIVDKGTCEKLVIYFAGHGYLNATSELWLLSGAPDDPSEAVDETLSAEMARSSNIANVVFISDCCRSIPATLPGQRVNGGSIFPNRTKGNVDTEVDHFFATQPGTAAIEAKIAEAALATGLFTQVLKDSHTDPPRDVMIPVAGKSAVPSRWLRKVLPDRTDEEAQRKSLALTQRAQIRLESDQSAYVGLARFTPPPLPPPAPPAPHVPRTPRDGMVEFSLGGGPSRRPAPPPVPPARRTWRDRPRKKAEHPPGLDSFAFLLDEDLNEAEVQALEQRRRAAGATSPGPAERGLNPSVPAWIQVTGSDIAAIGSGPRAGISEASPEAQHYGIGLAADAGGCSVALRFKDGTGTVVAALRDYLCRVTVGEGGVDDVSYVPIAGEWADLYRDMHERIDETRAVASAAVARGLLQINKRNAQQLAETTRRYKMFDPALGMVAALAYAAGGLRKHAVSVRDYSRQDLHADLFDIWLLAGAEKNGPPRYPVCPMMTQSWSYLEARAVKVHPVLKAAGRHSGFWTTFSRGDMDRIVELLTGGILE